MKNILKRLSILILILLTGSLSTLYHLGKNFAESYSTFGECGISIGPFYGDTVTIQPDSFDTIIPISDESLGIINCSNDTTPTLFKLNKDRSILWAIQLNTGDQDFYLSKIRIIELDSIGKRVTFINENTSEPGAIYFSENYDFEYFCLSPL